MIWVFFALFGDVSFCRGFCSWLRKNPLFVEKYPLFVEKFLEAPDPDLPKQNKFRRSKSDLPTKTFDSWLLPQFCWVCLICQIYINIVQRIVIASSPPTIAIIVCNNSCKNELSVPPRVASSLNLPVQLLALPSPPLPQPLDLLQWRWLEGRAEARRASHKCRAKIII